MTTIPPASRTARRDLPAELTLRFGSERLRGRVHWPAAMSVPALILLLAADGDGPAFARSLSRAARVAVLWFPTPRGERLERAALGWAADHATELGADPRLMLVAGVDVGAGHAARLAVAARDQGWPPLHRQALVHPRFAAAWWARSTLRGVAPATITAVATEPQAAGYAAALRAAGVAVDQLSLHRGGPPRGPQLGDLVHSLRLRATDERRFPPPSTST